MKLGYKLGVFFSGVILTYGLMMGFMAYEFASSYIRSDLLSSNTAAVTNLRDYFLDKRMRDYANAVACWVEDDRLISSASGDEPPASLRTEWQNYRKMNQSVAAIYFGAAGDGALYSEPAALGLPADYDPKVRQWYADAVSSVGSVVWSSPYIDAGAEGDLVVTLSQTVSKGSEIIGVVGMDLRLNDFSSYVEGTASARGTSVIITDRYGQVLAHPDRGKLGQRLEDAGWIAQVLDQESGNGYYTDAGSQLAYAFVTMPNTGWKVISIRKVDFGGLFGSLRHMTLGTAGVIALVMIFGGLLTGRLLLEPMRRLTDTIQSVASGDTDIRCDLESRDELGDIGAAFNLMLDRLAQINGERDGHLKALVQQNQEISSQKQEIHSLYEMTDAIHQELEESFDKMRDGYLETVKSLAKAIEANDYYTRGHCDRVSTLSLKVGREIGLSPAEMKDLEFAGILHDIGKLGVPGTVIHKPGMLTDAEYAQVMKHPAIGGEILQGVVFLEESRGILMQHHERYDGKGYPAGLSGEGIHRSARILAIADAYDAMTSDRPYRAAPLSEAAAREELVKGRGCQFDPQLTDCFLALLEADAPLKAEETAETAAV